MTRIKTGKTLTTLQAAAIRRQMHIIHDELAKLGKDVMRFDERLRRLTARIREAHVEAEQMRKTSEKLAKRFGLIKRTSGKA